MTLCIPCIRQTHNVEYVKMRDMAIGDDMTGHVVEADDLDVDYSHCILSPRNERQ